MNIRRRFLLSAGVLFLITLLTFISAISCSRDEANRSVAADTVPDVPEISSPPVPDEEISDAHHEAMITFLTGTVILEGRNGSSRPEIGDALVSGDLLKTGNNGVVELQLGNLGAIRIQQDTEYRLDAVALSSEADRASGSLSTGSLIARIRQLGGNDAFEVNIPGAVCAVRGTRFMVSAPEDGPARVSVSEGRVAVESPSLARVGSVENGIADSVESKDHLSAVRNLMPLVSMNETLVVPRDELQAADEMIAEWNSSADDGGTKGVDGAELTRRVRSLMKDIPDPEPISPDESQILRDQVPAMLQVSLLDNGEIKGMDRDSPRLLPLKVRAVPEDTWIFINGMPAGTGIVSRMFAGGSRISLAAESRDGRRQEKELILNEEVVIEFAFETPLPLPSEEPLPEPAAVVSRTPVEAPVTAPPEEDLSGEKLSPTQMHLIVTPRDAMIFIDGNFSGTGMSRLSIEPGQSRNVTAERPGYEPVSREIPYETDRSRILLELKPRLIASRTPLAGGPGVGAPVAFGERVIGATQNGSLYAVNQEGRILWNISSGIAGSGHLTPLVTDNLGFLMGRNELVVFNPMDGRIIARKALPEERAAGIDRRPVRVGDELFIPTERSLLVVDAGTGRDLETMEIPGKTRMSPTLWNDKLLIADLRGTLMYINPRYRIISRTVDTKVGEPVGHAPAADSSGIAVYAGSGGRVCAVNLHEARIQWERTLPGAADSGIRHDIIISYDIAYVFEGGNVHALDLATGENRFAPISGVTAAPLVHSGILYLCKDDGSIAMHNPMDGRLINSLALGERIIARPVSFGEYVAAAGESEFFIIDPRSLRR